MSGAAAAAAVLHRDKARSSSVWRAPTWTGSLRRERSTLHDTSALKAPWFLRVPPEEDRIKEGLANKQGIDQKWSPCGLILTADRLFICRRAAASLSSAPSGSASQQRDAPPPGFDSVLDSIPLEEIAKTAMTHRDSSAGDKKSRIL
jgi:hypothetical protein